MKRKSELSKIMRSFVLCTFLCACLMGFLVGTFKARANSEYALNGTEPEYVTVPDIVLTF